MNSFQFGMGQIVYLVDSREAGTVIGRCEFANAENSYLVRYKANDGSQVERWWGESALVAL